eukprot:scaffold50914_cov36-Tisochrysis_lutea.AAC.2
MAVVIASPLTKAGREIGVHEAARRADGLRQSIPTSGPFAFIGFEHAHGAQSDDGAGSHHHKERKSICLGRHTIGTVGLPGKDTD